MRNKTNVRYVDIKYVHEEDRTKCFLTYEVNIDQWPIFGFKIDADILLKVANKLGLEYYRVDKKTHYPTIFAFNVVATASCDVTQDDFDEEIGEHIALTRAQGKAFEKNCKFYDFIQIELSKSLDEITRLIDNNWHAANKCWEHAKDLGGY